jgi:hypothetical protein
VQIRTVEASMHGSLNRSDENQNRTDRNWNIGLFGLPVLVMIALVALAIFKPVASVWISEAAQAEFVGPNSPDVAPTKLAQPAPQIRTVKAY